MFDKVEFYRVDIRLLQELGHEVVLAGRPSSIDLKADLYYTWWWGHAPYTVLAGMLRRRPVIVTGAFDYATCRAELPGMCYLDKPLWQRLVLRSMLRLADSNLFISKHEHDEVTRNLIVRKPVCAPLAIDTDFYRPEPHDDRKSDFVFAVSWTSYTNVVRKGVRESIDGFARAAAEDKELRFVLAGKPGDHLDALKEQARRLGVEHKIEFVGMISDEQKRDYYRTCIAYVQPTLYEGFGHAIGEAVACGAPVITCRRGAVPEVAGAFASWVEPGDAEAIATAILERRAHGRIYSAELEQHAWIEAHYSLDNRRRLLSAVLASHERGRG